MVNAKRAVDDRGGGRFSSFRIRQPGLTAQVRLFGLLVLLVTLFAGLQEIVAEGVPRVEVRLVPRDVPVAVQVPVEVPVERVVERIVYVPVERPDGSALADASGPAPAVESVASDTGDALESAVGAVATEGDASATNDEAVAALTPEPAPAPVVADSRPAPAYVAPSTYAVAPRVSEAYEAPVADDEIGAEEDVEVAEASEPEPEMVEAATPPEEAPVARHDNHDTYVIQDENGASPAMATMTVVESHDDAIVAWEPEPEDAVAGGPGDEDLAWSGDDGAPSDEDSDVAAAQDEDAPADDEGVLYAKTNDDAKAEAGEEWSADAMAGAPSDDEAAYEDVSIDVDVVVDAIAEPQ